MPCAQCQITAPTVLRTAIYAIYFAAVSTLETFTINCVHVYICFVDIFYFYVLVHTIMLTGIKSLTDSNI